MIKGKSILLVATLAVLVIASLAACNGSNGNTTTPRTTTGPADLVEVTFFFESDNCFCLDLAVQWVDTVMTEDYASELAGGKLTYDRYDTRDAETAPLMEQFNATKFAFFITTHHGETINTWQVSRIWMYTDTSGTNAQLKEKFFGELHRNLDKALYGES
ncbi:MAG: hypothetical protein JW954_01530 [Dehalococcoidaceae bacterium]|nr:hypothetical protein [Dehalococcoidaceae bacterium]